VLDVADAIYLSDTISATFSRDAKKRAFSDSLKQGRHIPYLPVIFSSLIVS
jgi:hypothetical protein